MIFINKLSTMRYRRINANITGITWIFIYGFYIILFIICIMVILLINWLAFQNIYIFPILILSILILGFDCLCFLSSILFIINLFNIPR